MVPFGVQMMTRHRAHYTPGDPSEEPSEPVQPEPIIRLDFTWSRVIAISVISAFLGAAGAREFTMALQNQAQDIAIRNQGLVLAEHSKIIEEKLVTKEEFQTFVRDNEAALGRISARNNEIMQELLQHDGKMKR